MAHKSHVESPALEGELKLHLGLIWEIRIAQLKNSETRDRDGLRKDHTQEGSAVPSQKGRSQPLPGSDCKFKSVGRAENYVCGLTLLHPVTGPFPDTTSRRR